MWQTFSFLYFSFLKKKIGRIISLEAIFFNELSITEWGKQFNFPIVIHRVGQLSGDSENGVWNTIENIPSIVKGAQAMKIMPKNFPDVAWVPIDVAADAILETAFSDKADQEITITHIVHPRKFKWDIVLQILE